MNPWAQVIAAFFGCFVAGFVVSRLIRVFMTILRQPPHLNRRARMKLLYQEPNLRIRVNGQEIYLPHLKLLSHMAPSIGCQWRQIQMPNDGTPPYLVTTANGTVYHWPIELEMKSE